MKKLTTRQVVNVVLSNYFLALVTPGASGGAVAQIMFMRKAGVPVAKGHGLLFLCVRLCQSLFFDFAGAVCSGIVIMLWVDWMPTSVITIASVFICFAADCSSAAYEDQISGVLDHWVNEQFLRAISGGIVLFGIKNLNRRLLLWVKIL